MPPPYVSTLLGSLSLATLSLTFSPPQSQAVTLVNYQFTGTSLAPTSFDPNVSASNVNFDAPSQASQFTLSNVLAVNKSTGANDASTAVSNNSFFAFTVTPNPSVSLALGSLTFQAAAGNTGFANRDGYVIRSSVDNFSSNLSSGFFVSQFSTFTSFSVDLTAPSFQNITNDVTVRVYTFSPASNPVGAYDNISLNGTATATAVPFESDARSVVGATLFMAVGVWWKKKRSQSKIAKFVAQK